MKRLRRLYASDKVQGVFAFLVAQYVRLVYRTNRWRRVGYDISDRLFAQDRRLIFCFWHSRLLMMPFATYGGRPFDVMISSHRDGKFIARAVRHLGIGVVFGSSSRRPALALREAAQRCRDGVCLCITPDGPRGPRARAAPGAVVIAELAGAVLVPVAYATSRRRLLDSWDRFHLPLPIGRGVFVVGKEIEVPRRLDETEREQLRRRLEADISRVTDQADRLMGHAPVEPAPAS
ncbi:MAG TPA: lysophospholipid acyltransferase family protein [Candidatus Udaeobacter sp.]|nr:lysophospholipid acyltransferase family protein [Candidatus Udaeobacter sp.]